MLSSRGVFSSIGATVVVPTVFKARLPFFRSILSLCDNEAKRFFVFVFVVLVTVVARRFIIRDQQQQWVFLRERP